MSAVNSSSPMPRPQAGHKMEADPLGGVLVINNATGKFDGRISAPWAYDATGKALPTSFTISGDTITQHVDATGAVFPVVADPHYTWGWISGTVYFNKTETAKGPSLNPVPQPPGRGPARVSALHTSRTTSLPTARVDPHPPT